MQKLVEVNVTVSGSIPAGGTLSDFFGDRGSPRPGIIILDVKDGSDFERAKVPSGSELVSLRKEDDSLFVEPNLLGCVNKDGKLITGSSSVLLALSEAKKLSGLTMLFLLPMPLLTIVVAPVTQEFKCMGNIYDSLSNLSNELSRGKNSEQLWAIALRATSPKLQAQV